MNAYQHTQPGTLIRVALGGPMLVLLGVILWAPLQPRVELGIVAGILAITLLLFHSLTVTIDDHFLRLNFGIGLIRIKYQVTQIAKASSVKNKWYYGWGIRILWNGFLYNVSGLDAVEIVLSSGAVHRIGTDDPEGLTQAINAASHNRST